MASAFPGWERPRHSDPTGLRFDLQNSRLRFRIDSQFFQITLDDYQLTRVDPTDEDADEDEEASLPDGAPLASVRTGAETSLIFVNESAGEVELFWLDPSGRPRSYGSLPAGAQRAQHTYAGHVWDVRNKSGRTLALFRADEIEMRARIGSTPR